MSYLIKPAGYKALLNLSQTEMGIKKIKDFFQQNLSSELSNRKRLRYLYRHERYPL